MMEWVEFTCTCIGAIALATTGFYVTSVGAWAAIECAIRRWVHTPTLCRAIRLVYLARKGGVCHTCGAMQGSALSGDREESSGQLA